MEEIITDIPVIKVFHNNNKYYCYDTYTNNLFQVTKEVYLEICKLERIGIAEYRKLRDSRPAYMDVLALMDKGLFRFDFIKKIIHPDTKYIEQLVERCVSQLVLEVSSSCNFKCRYCHQPSKATSQPKMMKKDIAISSVDYLFEHSKDVNEINITFYGGEPLLNFELIKLVVSYTNKKFLSKPVFFNMTTNASLINDSIISFLNENQFSLLISLDGDEKTQNYHRKYLSDGGPTFNNVWENVLKIRDNYPKYFDSHVNFNAVVLPGETSTKVIDFFARNNISKNRVTISNADLTGIDYNITKPIVNGNNHNSFEEYFKDMLERFEKNDQLPITYHHSGPCVPATRRLFVSTEGKFYPCEKVEGAADCLLGTINTGIDLNKINKLLNIGSLTNEDCKKCWALRLCSICVRQCLDDDHLSYQKKKIACGQVRKNVLSFLREYVIHKETKEVNVL